MQEDIRKKVFLDVFVSKSTLLPIVVGGTVSTVAWTFDAWSLMFLGGATSLLGVGVFFTRFIFNLEAVTENAFNYLEQQKKQEFEESLDKLATELNEKDVAHFQLLRKVYQYHKDQLKNGEIIENDTLETKLDELFQACIKQLKYANELYKISQTLTSDAKKDIIQKRKEVLAEVKESTQCFNMVINEICAINTKKSNKELITLRNELQSSFDVVKRTQERVQHLGE